MVDWQKITLFLWFIFVQSLFAGEKTPKDVPVSTLLKTGFPPKLVATWKEKANGPREAFFKWKSGLKGKEAALVSQIWKTESLSYPVEPKTKEKDSRNEVRMNQEMFLGGIPGPFSQSKVSDPFLGDGWFLGLSHQNLDVQYLPRDEKNHSAFAVGRIQKGNRFILEKRDEEFLYGIDFVTHSFRFTSGNRYKPIPHFYFAKDPNFYSQMDRVNSPLPQPIQSSHFFGYQFTNISKNLEIGIYTAPGFSLYPGVYITSPNKSYSGVWSPGENKSSLYVNDSYDLGNLGKHRIQSESIFNPKETVGFLYSKSEFQDSKFLFDSTIYRDSPLLYGNVSSGEIRPEIPQTLGYLRGSYKHLIGGEGLSSMEGHRFEKGSSFFFPFVVSEIGNILYRYRSYFESGNYEYNEIGRAVFYEWRKDRSVCSVGFESREFGGQWEGKIAVPIRSGHLLELSTIFREGNLKTRAWFENWTYASDFNINLTDREEIIKLKYVSPFLSLNVSYSEKENVTAPILFINFQFLHLIEN